MELFTGTKASALDFTLLALASSILAGVVAYLFALVAGRFGLVSRHRRDRFSSRRVALTGGPGLLVGIGAVLLVLRAPVEPGWLVAAGGFFGVGLLDDRFELRPSVKLGAQGAVAIATALLLAPSAAYVGLVLVLFALLVNASNYLDNMDGLLGGVALVQSVALLFFAAETHPGSTLLVWALPGVLFLTLPPARLYLGDSGSHLIGALLAIDATRLMLGPDGVQTRYVLPLLLVFAVPLADAATVTISRLRRRRPIFRGGTDHLSHRLVRLGFPVPRAVLILVLASAACAVSSLLLLRA